MSLQVLSAAAQACIVSSSKPILLSCLSFSTTTDPKQSLTVGSRETLHWNETNPGFQRQFDQTQQCTLH